MFQYLLANSIASFSTFQNRATATKPKPVVRSEKVEVKKAKPNLIPLKDVISKNLDANRSSSIANNSLFAGDMKHIAQQKQMALTF